MRARKQNEQPDLFSVPEPMRVHPYQEVADRLWRLAENKIYLGSSSWKYESWEGVVYVENYRNKRDFEHHCLEEYSRIFPAVGGDFTFYNWPGENMISEIATQTPDGFKIGLKATEFVTLRRYPSIARWGQNAGKENPDFLNAELFIEKFLNPLKPIQNKLAPIIMEFTAFPKGSFNDWTEFATMLEAFFDKLPVEFQYGVEVRTREYIHDEFWAALKAMGVAPILNSWTRTPPLDEQWKLFPKHDFPFVECRPVMRPGRTRDEAAHLFEPYDRHVETVVPARRAMVAMAEWALAHKRPCYIFVNNHLEGCAHHTIREVSAEIEQLLIR